MIFQILERQNTVYLRLLKKTLIINDIIYEGENNKYIYEGNNISQHINDKFINKVMDIIEGGHLPNIMDFPNGCINSEKEMKFNNIIYYDDNIRFLK